MAITRDFKYCEWEAAGTMGMLPTWFDGADPTSGRGVAHDMLEHFKAPSTPVEGEAMAIGSFLLLRIETGAIDSSRSSLPPLAGDLEAVLTDIVTEGHVLPRDRASRPLDDYPESVVQEAVLNVYGRLEEIVAERIDEGPEEVQRWIDVLAATRSAMVSWIRKGYRKAVRRFKDADTHTVGVYLFKKVETLVDKLISAETLWPNAKVRISVYPKRQLVFARVFNPDDNRWVDADYFY